MKKFVITELKVSKRLISLILLVLPFFIFTFLKSADVGIDTKVYFLEYMYYSANGLNDYRSEKGFGSVSILLGHSLGLNFNSFLFFYSIVVFFAILYTWTLKKGEPVIYIIGLMAFNFFVFINSGIRQTFAIAFFSIACTVLLKHNRILTFSLLSVVAFTFHKTALLPSIFFFTLYIVFRSKDKVWLKILLIPFFLTALIFHYQASLTLYIANYQEYLDNVHDVLNYRMPIAFSIMSILSILAVLILRRQSLLSKWFQRKGNVSYVSGRPSQELDKYFNLNFAILILVPALYWVSTEIRLIDRVALYFLPLYWSIIAYLYDVNLQLLKIQKVKVIFDTMFFIFMSVWLAIQIDRMIS